MYSIGLSAAVYLECGQPREVLVRMVGKDWRRFPTKPVGKYAVFDTRDDSSKASEITEGEAWKTLTMCLLVPSGRLLCSSGTALPLEAEHSSRIRCGLLDGSGALWSTKSAQL